MMLHYVTWWQQWLSRFRAVHAAVKILESSDYLVIMYTATCLCFWITVIRLWEIGLTPLGVSTLLSMHVHTVIWFILFLFIMYRKIVPKRKWHGQWTTSIWTAAERRLHLYFQRCCLQSLVLSSLFLFFSLFLPNPSVLHASLTVLITRRASCSPLVSHRTSGC